MSVVSNASSGIFTPVNGTSPKIGFASGASSFCISRMNSLSGLALPLPIVYSLFAMPYSPIASKALATSSI